MGTRFLDTYYKLMFYKEHLIKELRENEEFVEASQIDKHLENIDLHSSLFKKGYEVKPDKKLNVEELNRYIYYIHNDLKILYTILERLAVEKFNQLEDQINGNILSLESAVSLYTQRSQLELNSSFLGDTLLYRDSNLEVNEGAIDLGEHNFSPGSTIACIVSGANLESDKIRFHISNGENSLYVGPHNFQQTVLSIPGNTQTKSYSVVVDDLGGESAVDLSAAEGLEVNSENNYYAFNGINKIKVSDKVTKRVEYLDMSNNESIHIDNNSYISFYAPEGSDMSFEYSSEPIYSSFDGVNLRSPTDDSHVVIECPADFIMSFSSNKDIYIDKQKCFVDDSALLYPKQTEIGDFLIVESIKSEKVPYRVIVDIINSEAKVDYVAIKELIKQ